MMKDDKFFKLIPYPFCAEEEKRLKNKILSSLPINRNYVFLKLAIAFALILITISVPFFISNNKFEEKEKIIVLNPLKIKSEEIVIKDFPFPPPYFSEEKVQDIPFYLVKYDHSIKLQWDQKDFQKFRVKKCTNLPPQNNCFSIQETDKNYFIDEEIKDAKFIIYIVEAVKG